MISSRYKDRLKEYLAVYKEMPQYKEAIEETVRTMKNKNAKTGDDTVLYVYAILPVLVEFSKWIIKEALKDNKQRIYFLSRDGYQIYLICKQIVERRGLDLECKYLSVSRFSMRIAGYFLDIEESIDSICVGGIDVTPEKIIKRGGLSDDQCKEVLKELKPENNEKFLDNQILNYREVLSFRKVLKQSKLFRQYVEEISKEKYANTIEYLKQEGLLDYVNYVIVDSGWIGTLQLSIEKLVKSVNPDKKLDGYYFGMYEIPKNANINNFKTYYFSSKKGVRRKSRFSNSLFETIVSATEGMTIGYEKKLDKYIPMTKINNNPNAKQLANNIGVINDFVAAIKDELQKFDYKKSIRLSEKLLTLFMSKPTMLELECYGDNKFSDDVLDADYNYVAAKLSISQIKDQRLLNKLLIVTGFKKREIRESAWLEGSALRAYNTEIKDIKKLIRESKKEFRHIRLYKYLIFLKKQIQK